MPLYEFECSGCGKVFELALSIKAGDDLQFCPECWKPCRKNINFRGSTLTEDAPWIREAAEHLSNPTKDGKVEPTRSALYQHMKKTGTVHKDTSPKGRYMV